MTACLSRSRYTHSLNPAQDVSQHLSIACNLLGKLLMHSARQVRSPDASRRVAIAGCSAAYSVGVLGQVVTLAPVVA